MNKLMKFFLLCSLIDAAADDLLVAGINWGSRNSGIVIGNGAELNVGAGGMEVRGTIALGGGIESLQGGIINFDLGVLDKEGRQALLTAEYQPQDSITGEVLVLNGVSTVYAQNDVPFDLVTVNGQDNYLFGLLHAGRIVFNDANSLLSIGVQNPLDGNIELHGGTLRLENDLILGNGVQIIGPGTIDKQYNKLMVADSTDSTAWANNLHFINGTSGVDEDCCDSDTFVFPVPDDQQSGAVYDLNGNFITVTYAKPINLVQNCTIEGNYGGIDFDGPAAAGSSQTGPLFSVAAGKKVRLQNITLSNITQNTFGLGAGAVVELGDNVVFEFGGDTIITSGVFRVIRASGGSNVVTMRGLNGSKLFVLSPIDVNQTTVLDLNNNSVAIQDLELIGARFIAPNGTSASIALTGGAVIDMEASNALNIDVDGNDNLLALVQDGLTLSGSFGFNGLSAENVLRVRFALSQPVQDKTITSVDANGTVQYIPVAKGNPLVIFNGDVGVDLMNQETLGALVFEDPSVSIANGLNSNTNGFIIDKCSLLGAFNLEILVHPIKQYSSQFILQARSITGKGIDQSYIRSRGVDATSLRTNKVRTAYARHCDKIRAQKNAPQRVIPAAKQTNKNKVGAALVKQKKQQNKNKNQKKNQNKNGNKKNTKQKNKKNKQQVRSISFGVTNPVITRSFDFPGIRALDLPAQYQRSITDIFYTNTTPELGTTLYNASQVQEFQTTSDSYFNIVLQDGALLKQKSETTLFIGENQVVNVVGNGNQIQIAGDAEIDLSYLNFDENASLILNCSQTSATQPVLKLRGTLSLPQGAALFLLGSGSVSLADQAAIALNGTSASQALFSIGNGITVAPDANGTFYVGGVGKFEVADGATLKIGANAAAKIAQLPAALAADVQDHAINFSVVRNGNVLIAADASADTGALTFVGGQNNAYAFEISNAKMVVGSTGTLAFNVNDALQPLRGELTSLSLSLASISLYGSMILGPNKYNASNFIEDLTNFTLNESGISGGGLLISRDQDPVSLTTIETSEVMDDVTYLNVQKAAEPSEMLTFEVQ